MMNLKGLVPISKGEFRQYLTALCVSLCSFSGSSAFAWVAPLLVWLKSKDSEIPLTPDQSSWVVSIILLGNTIITIPTAVLVDICGRKPLLLSTGPLFISSWIVILGTRSVAMLYLARLLQGLGMGIVYTVLPLYLGEIACPRIRASIGYFFPCIWYAGSLYEYATGPYVSYNTLAWITLIPPIVFLLTFAWFPESPYFLLMKGREEEAGKSLAWLRGEDTVEGVSGELTAIKNSVAEEMANSASWRDLVKTDVGRKSLTVVTLVGASYIMCGGTALFSYSTDTFTKIGGGIISPAECTILMCSVLLVIVPFSGIAVDVMGRRPVLMISAVGSTICLVATSTYLYLADHTLLDVSDFQWFPYFTIIFYTVLIGAGIESIVPVLQAEMFSNTTRGPASCISFLLMSVMSFFCLKMYQVIGDGVGLSFLYGFFAFFAACGGLYIHFFVPETKGKTFAEIQEILKSGH